jgi:L-ornithine N5-oxygenase
VGHQEVELLAIGSGPSNLALAVCLEEVAPDLAQRALIIEAHHCVAWQRGMLLPWTQSQVSFIKDLVTLRNPRSQFSFINYLHNVGRLDSFVNVGSFTPYRIEISSYLQWVANALPTVRLEYSRRAARIDPIRSNAGAINAWNVQLADGSEITARSLSIGIGRDPHIPEIFKALPSERVVHSTQFSDRVEFLDTQAPHRIAVIGSAQSAAEMLWAAHQGLPNSTCTMVMRAIGLNAYESSRFTNELYYPSFTEEFYAAQSEAKLQLLAEMHRSNYSGLAPGTLDTLYRQLYLEQLTNVERLRFITMSDVVDAQMSGDEVALTLANRRTGAVTELMCDVVLLGTGFSKEMPALVRQLAESVGLDEIRVSRNYRLALPQSATASVHLQGVNEGTHGIADSLLSVLAIRAGEIVADLQRDRRSRASLSLAAA